MKKNPFNNYSNKAVSVRNREQLTLQKLKKFRNATHNATKLTNLLGVGAYEDEEEEKEEEDNEDASSDFSWLGDFLLVCFFKLFKFIVIIFSIFYSSLIVMIFFCHFSNIMLSLVPFHPHYLIHYILSLISLILDLTCCFYINMSKRYFDKDFFFLE